MSHREATTRGRRTLIIAAAAGLAAAAAVAAATGAAAATGSASAKYPVVSNVGPRFTVAGGASVLPTTQTVPHWHGSFVDGANGQTYGFNMVGTDPGTRTSTAVDSEIIPLNFSFAADHGAGFGAGQAASWAAQSPIFQPTALPSGETAQYLDAVMRSEFSKIGSGYHVRLANAGILAARTITVPQSQGALYELTNGTVLGLVNGDWFGGQLQSILASSHLSPTTLPIVISDNVYLYVKSLSNCCVVGFHGAGHPTGLGAGSTHGNGNQPVPTFAWASWIPIAAIFGPGVTDVVALSHEISEWGHDPFVNNFVNPWEVPGSPQYGCSNVLETGDPLVGTDFTAGSNPDPATGPQWHLQDEAFLWWFERQPTQASNHEYSYLGIFTSPAPTC
jgi:hypothetical protein